MNRRKLLTLGILDRGTGTARNRRDTGLPQNPAPHARRSNTGLEPFAPTPGNPWDYSKAAHLLRRCMVGPTDTEIRQGLAALQAQGIDPVIQALLTPFVPPPTLISDWAGKEPQIRPGPGEDAQVLLQEIQRRGQMLQRWWLRVIATGPASIQERMVLFWHNHFTSELQVVNLAEWMYGQNQLFRSKMLGNFKQLVKDVTKDMAMLVYLDGVKNFKQPRKDNINENYARELMELFTCGVVDWDNNPNYTEQDVREAARALSGWTYTQGTGGALYAGLTSQFIQLGWDSGSKTIMGRTGAWKADDVVDIIFEERADQVAKFICEKIYRTFVYDIPDRVVVAAMADTLRASNWELRPVMVQLLKSAHFFDVTNIGALDKSPADFMLGLIRGMRLGSVPDFQEGNTRFSRDLMGRMSTLGMILLDPPNVKGWPGGRTWISTSTLPVRQKTTLDIVDQKLGVANGPRFYTYDPVAFAKTFPDPNDIHRLSADMALFFLNTPPSDKEAKLLFDALLDGGVDYEWNVDDPDQKPAERIRKFLKVVFQLPKYQLH